MPKLKTHSGAAKRFSKTGTGKIKRGQTKTEAQAGSDPACLRRRLREGSAHDSLRLTTCGGADLWFGSCHKADGPKQNWPPGCEKRSRQREIQACRASEEVYRPTKLALLPPAA
jgi:ribosomal protein L35